MREHQAIVKVDIHLSLKIIPYSDEYYVDVAKTGTVRYDRPLRNKMEISGVNYYSRCVPKRNISLSSDVAAIKHPKRTHKNQIASRNSEHLCGFGFL